MPARDKELECYIRDPGPHFKHRLAELVELPLSAWVCELGSGMTIDLQNWISELEKPDHKLHGLYLAVKDRISGACEFCAGAFGVKLAGDYEGHPSFKKLVSQGYQIITF